MTTTQFLVWWVSLFDANVFLSTSKLEKSLVGVAYDELTLEEASGLRSWRRCSKTRRRAVARRILWPAVCLDRDEHHPNVNTSGSLHYMVKNEVWLQAVPDYLAIRQRRTLEQRADYKAHWKDHKFRFNAISHGWVLLCPACLVRRLGRRLTPEDFTDALINSEPGALMLQLKRRW